jgi:ArsR family transcriptional regulator
MSGLSALLCRGSVADSGGVDDSTAIELSVARFRALGDPIRLRVVHELAGGTRCVCELRERIDVAGPLLSHHLTVLRDAGLVSATRRGRWIDYRLDAEVLETLFTLPEPALAAGAQP